MSNEVIERLDRIIMILQLAFRASIEDARAQVREDLINIALLDATVDAWTAGGELVPKVVQATGASSRSVSRRLASLVALGAIEKRGGGAQTTYRATGLI